MFNLGRCGGRGGGRGGGKRPIPPPQLSRPATAPSAGRLPIGGGGGGGLRRPNPGGGAPQEKEETFRLSSAANLEFGAIIRLTPDLIEEITRVESQGGSAKIKFAPNSNIPNGNVIDVGGKEFGFTWSRDELCDIYEEHQSGEGGDGLLVECGSAWRKLNVHRILDESTKKHVKKRSEEAERLLKSRKAIILDPSNPSMKNHVQKMAAAGVEGNMRRMGWKQKKEPFFKKQKTESNQVSNVCPPKSAYKSGTSSNKPVKGTLSVVPTSSPPEQPTTNSAVSPFATGISFRSDENHEEITPPRDMNKEHIGVGNFKKEMPSKGIHGAKQKFGGQKMHSGDQAIDFQSNRECNVSEIPMGMKIEAPGKYLKPGVEVETSNQRESESGSSPESSHDIASAIESIFEEKITDGGFEQQAQLTSKVTVEDDPFERIDIMQDDPDPITTAEVKSDSGGKTSSSESDSESDSSGSGSDSGSQSRSRSRSKSPVASASSSDSDSDGSSSSKDGSDVDVDIMPGDDKREAMPKTIAADIELFSSPRVRASDEEQEQIDILGDQEEQFMFLPIDSNVFGRDYEMANPLKGAKEYPHSNSIKTSEIPEINLGASTGSNLHRANSKFPVEVSFSPDQYKHSKDPQIQFVKSPRNANEQVIMKTVNDQQPIHSDWDQIKTTKKTKTKKASGSGSGLKEKPETVKRSEGARETEVMPCAKSKDGALAVNSYYMSPEKARQNQYKSNYVKRQSEGKISFKPSENKAAFIDSSNLDIGEGKNGSHLPPVAKNHSLYDLGGDVHGNQEGFGRKILLNDPIDTARVQSPLPSQGQQPSRIDHADSEVKSHLELSGGEAGTNLVTGLENHAGFPKKSPTNLPPQYGIKHGGQKGYKNAKESKQQASNALGDSTNRSNSSASRETETNGRKRRESSTDDDTFFYSKYEKDAPQLRDSIKDFSEYNDYLQEFHEKYECYVSLNMSLENIRNEFLKVGEDLELAKGRGLEEYYRVVEQLREMYHRHGERNKQMKRVFVVLHEELKTLKQRIREYVEMHTRE